MKKGLIIVSLCLVSLLYSQKIFLIDRYIGDNSIGSATLHYIDRKANTVKSYPLPSFNSDMTCYPIYIEKANKFYFGRSYRAKYIGMIFDLQTETFKNIERDRMHQRYQRASWIDVDQLKDPNTYSISVRFSQYTGEIHDGGRTVKEFARLKYNVNTGKWATTTKNDKVYEETPFKKKRMGPYRVYIPNTKGTFIDGGSPYLPKSFFMTNYNIPSNSYLDQVATSTCKLTIVDKDKKIYMRSSKEGKFYVVCEEEKREYFFLKKPTQPNVERWIYGWIIPKK